MARLSVGQKSQRVLRFVMGLNQARVASALAAHGFTEADRLEAYELLKRLTDNRLNAVPPPPPDRTLVARLDAWENRWFPIASASLVHRFPEVHERLFRNLSQTDGPEVVFAVGALVRRIDELDKSQAPTDVAARELLHRRGLTADVVAEAHALLDKVGVVETPLFQPPITPEEMQAREEALWAWYLEWSTIARTAIQDRSLLRALGFLNGGGGRVGGDEEEVGEEVADAVDAGEVSVGAAE